MIETIQYREEWLERFAHDFAIPLINGTGAKVADKIRFTCGFPSVRPTSAKRQRVGECWYPEASADGRHEVIVSMVLGDPLDVAETTIHELIHTVVGSDAGHKAPFKRVATAVGLAGKMTSTILGDDLRAELERFLPSFPLYPHGALSPTVGRKKQSTRLLKAYCPDCVGSDQEYTIRLSRKVADIGLPLCPTCDDVSLILDE